MNNLPDNIEMMAYYLGRDDPAIRRLLKVYVRDPRMRATVTSLLKRRCMRAGFDPDDPPDFLPPRQLPPGELHLGRLPDGSEADDEFALPKNILAQHMGTFGHNGTGKTFLAMHLAEQAIRKGMRVWIFDIEDEYCRIIPHLSCGGLLGVEPGDLRFNLFQPPGDWTSNSSWLDELGLLLRGATFLRDGSLNLFRTGMNKLLERKGITKGGTNRPSLTEVVEYFGNIRFGPKSRSAGFLESILNRLLSLTEVFEQTASVSTSNMLEMLASRSVIFRLHRLVGIPLQFLVSFMLLWLARYREGNPGDKPHIVIIEEAHMLSSQKSRQDIGENVLSRMFRTARKRGIALILCDQVPSELPPAILGNLACRIVMRLANSRCIWSLQSSMGLTRRQANAISAMEFRKAVVHYTLHPTAFAIELPELNFPERPAESELQKTAADLLSQAEYTQYESADKKPAAQRILSPDDPAGDALLVIKRICEAPAETIDNRCTALQLDRAREFRARAELDQRGFIEKVEQSLAGKVKFFRPTKKGADWAKKYNIRVRKFKSGIVHEYLLCRVEKCIGTAGPKWRLQRNSSIGRDQGLQPDLLAMGPEGVRIIAEICCSNFDYDANNIIIEAGIREIDRVIAVTPDKKTKTKLEKALNKTVKGTSENWQDSVILLDAGLCLSEDFDWQKVLTGNENLFGDV